MQQKAILIGVIIPSRKSSFLSEIEELKSLCFACEMDVLEVITQNLDEINGATYINKGKMDEIKMVLQSLSIDALVFNDELTPGQIHHLNNFFQLPIYDRTYVILEIFKRRAKTKEAILQVDIASLRYFLPRLTSLRNGFSRQGASSGGAGAYGKGKGETQLEIDRRNIQDRITFLKKELEKLKQQREIQRKARKKSLIKTISLVGYTNSGKSSTLNALLSFSKDIKKEVMEKDMLFATLETSTRKITLKSNRSFLVTDTVGFVHKLPHTLVEAFKSTLEEIKESDLLLHVVDASNPNFDEQIKVTEQVLKEIGVEDIPIIYVFNKIDLVEGYFYIPPQYEKATRMSATEKKYIEDLLQMIEKELFQDQVQATFKIPYTRGDIVHLLNTQAQVLQTTYKEWIEITAQVNTSLMQKFKEFIQ